MAENENEKLPNQLADEELEEANGGFCNGIQTVKDSAGRTVGEYIYGVLKWSPCPNCQLPLHEGSFFTVGLFCDKCDERYSSADALTWTGTREELIALADKNI